MKKKFLIPLVFLLCGCSFSNSTSSTSQFSGSIQSTLESSKVDNDSTSDIVSSEISSSSEDLVPTEGLNFVDTLDYFRMMSGLPADYEFTDEELLELIGNGYLGSISLEELKTPSYSIYDFQNEITAEEVSIPNSYNGRPVLITCIGYNQNIKKINVASKFAMIGGLPNLEEITSFNGNVALGVNECENLKKAIIHNNIEYLGFYNCNNLNYNEYDNALYLGNDDNPYLALIKAKNEEITSCNINDKCKVLAYRAFAYCKNLTSVTIPDSVTTIGDHAFFDCDSLTSVTIGNNVTTIDYDAFAWCSSLTKVNYTGTIDQWVQIDFDSSSSNPVSQARDLYINNQLVTEANIQIAKKINAYAFCNYANLTNVTIGNSVTTIGEVAFSGCSSLTNITVDENNPNYKSIDGNLYTKDGSTLIQYAIGKKDLSFVIPDSVTTIGSNAFEGCRSLTSITIPDSVTTIGEYAFAWCDSLTSVKIPESVTTIGKSAFFDCDSLTSVTIPDSVTTIGKSAFEDCDSLTSVTIGNNVTTIGNWAFEDCSNLISVTIPDSVTTIGEYAFAWCRSLTNITYNGTIEQWNNISKGYRWNDDVPATVVHCTDGDVDI